MGNSTYLDCYGDQWVLEQQYREGSEWLEHSEKVVIDVDMCGKEGAKEEIFRQNGQYRRLTVG